MKQITGFATTQRQSQILRSKFFNESGVVVYLRAGKYHYDRKTNRRYWALGVSNINLTNPKDQGKGLFRGFIVQLEALAKELKYRFVRVEEVHNQELLMGLEKHGYQVLDMGEVEGAPIVYKEI